MMKRILALLTALVLLAGCAAASGEAAEEGKLLYKIEEKKFPLYYGNANDKAKNDFPLYFVNGVDDLPFVNLEDWCAVLSNLFTDEDDYKGFTLTVSATDGVVSIERENGSVMTCNFVDGEIAFTDFTAFRADCSGLYINMGTVSSSSPDVVDVLGVTGKRERRGKPLLLELWNKYGIHMIAQDGKYLIPLQTLSYLNLSNVGYAAFFNQKELMLCGVQEITEANLALVKALSQYGLLNGEIWELAEFRAKTYAEKVAYCIALISEISEEGKQFIENWKEMRKGSLAEMYYDAPTGERSEELAVYGYNELCMELDNEYGLQEAHKINGFAEYFEQTGLTNRLLSRDAAEADAAVGELTDFWFDDGHSTFLSNSYLAKYDGIKWGNGFSQTISANRGAEAELIRRKYKNADTAYVEIGDTAIVTLDEFSVHPNFSTISDYYMLAEADKLGDDMISEIIKAHKKITREGSPVKKVVLDLSCNGGGAAVAAVFAVSWFLGEALISCTDPVTGAESTVAFRADVNLDHEFDYRDNLSDLELYCLISPSSFSCGNLVPWAFKADGRVTLLGKTSGGGSCVVRRLATAWGGTFQVSGAQRISFVKNGAYYDVDQGVEPDVFIRDYNNFFDREALIKIINDLR